MAKVLHITASPRGERSHSRKLGGELVTAWLEAHPGDTVTLRDVGHNPPPHVTEPWVAAAFSPPDQQTSELRAAIRASDELVDELMAHEILFISTPMYNFGVPSTLKAYIDNIVRAGRTFGYDPTKKPPYIQLVHGKRLAILTARGGAGYGPGGPMERMNFEAPYLRAIFGFIGVTDTTVIQVENSTAGDQILAASFDAAREEIRRFVTG